MLFKIVGEFFLGVSVKRGVIGIERNIVETRQAREDRKFRELRNARYVEEANLVGVVLELCLDSR